MGNRRGAKVVWAITVLALGSACTPEPPPALRVGLEAVGTLSWVAFAMQHYGIHEEVGIAPHFVTYPTKAAKELALRTGAVDVVVDDFVAVSRWWADGQRVRAIHGYSTLMGGVVVPVGSELRSLDDLRGRTLGVTSMRDNSLLVLRAVAVRHHAFDPAAEATVRVAAPPLMEALLARGELDAAAVPWHIAARMLDSGLYRELASGREMLEALGMSADLPVLMLVVREELPSPLAVALVEALTRTVERMSEDEGIWPLILAEGLYTLPDPSRFPAVVEAWRTGIPGEWSGDAVRDLARLLEVMVALAGPEVVGVDRLHPEAYATGPAPLTPPDLAAPRP